MNYVVDNIDAKVAAFVEGLNREYFEHEKGKVRLVLRVDYIDFRMYGYVYAIDPNEEQGVNTNLENTCYIPLIINKDSGQAYQLTGYRDFDHEKDTLDYTFTQLQENNLIERYDEFYRISNCE